MATPNAPEVRSAQRAHKPGGQHPMKTSQVTQQPVPMDTDGSRPDPILVPQAAPVPLSAPLQDTARAREAALRPGPTMVRPWHFRADHGATLEDLLRPEYWLNVAKRFSPFDEITVWFEDGSAWAQLLVISCSAKWAKMKFIGNPIVIEESGRAEIPHQGHKIKWAGGTVLYRVVRDRDNADLKSGFPTAGQAMAWLEDHLRAMAA